MLKFGPANAKLQRLESITGRKVWQFSLLSGHSCPFAHACLSKAVEIDGKLRIKDGPHTEFRCFSASEEAIFTTLYKRNKHNFDLLKQTKNQYKLISESLPCAAGIVRLHVSGDMYSQSYFDSWCKVATDHPNIHFYGYTKSINYWLSAKQRNLIPNNLILTASFGGRQDNLIKEHNLRHCAVIADVETCQNIQKLKSYNVVPSGVYEGYPIDHTDEHACLTEHKDTNFALLIHAIQPAKSEASRALEVLGGKNGISSYNRK